MRLDTVFAVFNELPRRDSKCGHWPVCQMYPGPASTAASHGMCAMMLVLLHPPTFAVCASGSLQEPLAHTASAVLQCLQSVCTVQTCYWTVWLGAAQPASRPPSSNDLPCRHRPRCPCAGRWGSWGTPQMLLCQPARHLLPLLRPLLCWYPQLPAQPSRLLVQGVLGWLLGWL